MIDKAEEQQKALVGSVLACGREHVGQGRFGIQAWPLVLPLPFLCCKTRKTPH